MIDNATVFLYVKDFSLTGKDRYFLWDRTNFKESDAREICNFKGTLLTHDFWLISSSLHRATRKLPSAVIDILDLQRATSGLKSLSKAIDQDNLKSNLSHSLSYEYDTSNYIDIYYGRSVVDIEVLLQFAQALYTSGCALEVAAKANGEFDRFKDIELPVANYLWKSAAEGIKLDKTILRKHKENIESEYFRALKDFAIRFNKPFEVPSESAAREHLLDAGFEFDDVSLDYILKFLPSPDEYAEELIKLRKISNSRMVLADMPLSKGRANPFCDSTGSITSRIIYRNPAVQNLAKKYRNIFCADTGMRLGYIDYSQFEIGIMAELSNDMNMWRLYVSGDAYTQASLEIFESTDYRKRAKRLMLAYAYGMPIRRLADAAAAEGAIRTKATTFFRQFDNYEIWRKSVAEKYLADGRVGTNFGNFRKRETVGPLSFKESRSCVSQVVQGTASLIFKKMLLALSAEKDVRLLIPMHDAIFFQAPQNYKVSRIKQIFEKEFTSHFGGDVHAQATIGQFYSPNA
ncbi:MAG: DNA polymerase [Polaromonas sp.]|nr:DNA polymerase [Polaromonas sp.]